MWQNNNADFRIYFGGAYQYTGTGLWSPGALIHFAYTRTGDGTTHTMYVNGVNVHQTTSGTSAVASFYLGSGYNGQASCTVLDLRNWSRGLSAAEVRSLYSPTSRWDLYWVPSRRVYIDAPAGGASATASTSDTLTVTDAASQLVTLIITSASAADSVTVTDEATQLLTTLAVLLVGACEDVLRQAGADRPPREFDA